jgi:hypothetical protein
MSNKKQTGKIDNNTAQNTHQQQQNINAMSVLCPYDEINNRVLL